MVSFSLSFSLSLSLFFLLGGGGEGGSEYMQICSTFKKKRKVKLTFSQVGGGRRE